MSFSRVLPVLVVAALTLAGPATAEDLSGTDPVGDASGPGLDVRHVTYRNLDHRVVARVRFVDAVPGDLIVSVSPRGASGVRLVSEYRPHHTTRSFVLAGAWTDGRTKPGALCPGFSASWSRDADRAVLRMPSSCLQRGDFGAVRFAVLTEGAHGGDDTDYAPRTPNSTTAWLPRG